MPRRASVAVLLFASAAFGWGEAGHRIVADMAARHLTPQAQAAAVRLLDSASADLSSTRSDKRRPLVVDQVLADVAPWADQVRNDPRYRWTSALHYANVEPGAEAFDWARAC